MQQEGLSERRAQSQARRNLLFGRNEALERHLDGVRSSLVDAVVTGLAVIAAVVVPASLARSLVSGWQPVYGAHLALGIAGVLFYLMRHRLGDRIKSAVTIGLFWTVGLTSLFAMGLAGAGIWWLVISSLLVSALYSVRAGLLTMLGVLVAIGVAGAAWNAGLVALPVNAVGFLRSPSAWISAAIGATLMPLLVFRAIAAFNASTVGLLREAAEQRELIRELATHDELTGVPTFTLALDRLEQALRAAPRTGRSVGLLFMDLDGFKAINDTLGHEAGNAVLVTVARRLRLNLRAEDTVARVGGDEFVAILTGISNATEAVAVAAKLQRVLCEPIQFGDEWVVVASSIGAAYAADSSQSAEQLMRAADAAMYDAKRSGTNQVRVAASPAAEPLDVGPEPGCLDHAVPEQVA